MTDRSENDGFSRRDVIAMAGGAVGLAVLAGANAFSGWSNNEPELDADEFTRKENEADVLVIGGGMAGLFAAVKAHDAGAKTVMVSKGRLGASGQTPFAKGIFAYDPSTADVGLDEFVDAVSRSAIGTNNPVFTRQMAEHSLDRVNELREWGFFDSPLYFNAFMTPMRQRRIPIIERVMITHLLKEDGRIAGAAGFSMDKQLVRFFRAKSVILCTGAGGFKPNGFPICDLTHDGTVMAYRIGAKVTGKEWNDGHPGQATNPAACYDGWHGMFERKPGVTGVGIRHDLGVEMNYAAYMKGNPTQMGPPGMGRGSKSDGGPQRPPEFNRRGSPPRGHAGGPLGGGPPGGGPPGGGPPGGGPRGGGGSRRKGGHPPGPRGPSVGGSSAGMAIHKSEGLTPINEKCASTIPGLYAAGDALGSYMAGAIYTQIGSSLAGSAVQGAVAGAAASEYARTIATPTIPVAKCDAIQEDILAPLKRESGYGPAWVTQTLQSVMIPNFVIYIKKESILKAALAYIEELRDHHTPMLRAADMHELRLAHETGNMILSAEMKLRASLMRKESRCSHFRLDYPGIDRQNWQAWINIYKGSEGEMRLEKQPFDRWPD